MPNYLSRALGLALSRSAYTPRRSVLSDVEVSAGGNVILRVGREHGEGYWSQTEHVVMTPDEARALHAALGEALEEVTV